MKTAVIFGVTGQDGSYLAELLLAKGYRVVGVSRRVSVPTDERIRHLGGSANFQVLEGDVTDPMSVHRILKEVWPDEVYNLAAQSNVATSFKQPATTWQVTAAGVLNILESLRALKAEQEAQDGVFVMRFYQASSSEMFGSSYTTRGNNGALLHYRSDGSKSQGIIGGVMGFQCETTPFTPCSPYGVAKAAAHHMVQVYREAYGLHASCGILYNHESERRGEAFVTRKITKHLAGLVGPNAQVVEKLKLGNLDAYRDWGHAEDYVRGMWQMLQQPQGDDYVLATGETRSVRQFLLTAFELVGIHLGNCMNDYVEIDPSLYRPVEVPMLRGDATKALLKLNWKPEVTFNDLVRRMVYADVAALWGRAHAEGVVCAAT